MAKRGTAIEGWWAWFQAGDSRTARRFETREDALEWQPNTKGQVWLREKVIMRVSMQAAINRPWNHPWSNDPIELHPGPETVEEAYARIARELKQK
jgi:hypothetical protein